MLRPVKYHFEMDPSKQQGAQVCVGPRLKRFKGPNRRHAAVPPWYNHPKTPDLTATSPSPLGTAGQRPRAPYTVCVYNI